MHPLSCHTGHCRKSHHDSPATTITRGNCKRQYKRNAQAAVATLVSHSVMAATPDICACFRHKTNVAAAPPPPICPAMCKRPCGPQLTHVSTRLPPANCGRGKVADAIVSPLLA